MHADLNMTFQHKESFVCNKNSFSSMITESEISLKLYHVPSLHLIARSPVCKIAVCVIGRGYQWSSVKCSSSVIKHYFFSLHPIVYTPHSTPLTVLYVVFIMICLSPLIHSLIRILSIFSGRPSTIALSSSQGNNGAIDSSNTVIKLAQSKGNCCSRFQLSSKFFRSQEL